MIKERPIIFSTPMVHAILNGRKTQTRRIVKPDLTMAAHGKFNYKGREITGNSLLNYCPYGKPGDLLWVRETFADSATNPAYQIFKAAVNDDTGEGLDLKWKPSIHMPKAAARTWLRVTGIMVERLQDICAGDIKSEGVRIPVSNKYSGNNKVLFRLDKPYSALHFLAPKDGSKATQDELLQAFWAELWCDINGIESWNENPWVWVVTFEVVSTTGKPVFEPNMQTRL